MTKGFDAPTPVDAVIDVSHHNGRVDWKAVAADGIALAFLKAVEGVNVRDPMFLANLAGAQTAGILTIAYDFLRPASEGGAPAMFFAKVAGLVTGTPYMLDFEGRASQTASPQIVEEIGLRLTEITERKPVGYWGDERIPGTTPGRPTTEMETWDRFIPRYPHEPAPSFASLPPSAVAKLPMKGARFVQYSRTGRVAGISGNVDRSVWIGTLDQLKTWHATGQLLA